MFVKRSFCEHCDIMVWRNRARLRTPHQMETINRAGRTALKLIVPILGLAVIVAVMFWLFTSIAALFLTMFNLGAGLPINPWQAAAGLSVLLGLGLVHGAKAAQNRAANAESQLAYLLEHTERAEPADGRQNQDHDSASGKP